MEGRALERARSRAVALLESDECRKVFVDFTDAKGRTLQEKLHTLGLGENPPTPMEITPRVYERCRPLLKALRSEER